MQPFDILCNNKYIFLQFNLNPFQSQTRNFLKLFYRETNKKVFVAMYHCKNNKYYDA